MHHDMKQIRWMSEKSIILGNFIHGLIMNYLLIQKNCFLPCCMMNGKISEMCCISCSAPIYSMKSKKIRNFHPKFQFYIDTEQIWLIEPIVS